MTSPDVIRQNAFDADQAGLCVVPPAEDGTKRPDGAWKRYQQQRPSHAELEKWYSDGRTGLGAICGAVSQNLETLEFEEFGIYQDYKRLAQATGLGDLVSHIESGYSETSPGSGIHWLYRCSQIEGNTKLARQPKRPEEMSDPNDNVRTLIETRGQGGYIILAPSYGQVHPSGKPYRLLQGGFDSIATITPEERAALLELARAFDQMPRQQAYEPGDKSTGVSGVRPGDDFNARGDWANILEPRGWRPVFERDRVTYWRRPGKDRGVSATTNFAGSGLLYVFSTSTPFEAERGYSKFSAYALLEHGNDFAAAAEALQRVGYGTGGRSAIDASAPSEWEHPEPFESVDVPEFPLDSFPKPVANYVAQEAESKQVPLDLPGCLVIGGIAAAAGGKCNVSLAPDWQEPVNEYVVSVMPSGERKSPEFRSVLKPLEDVERELVAKETPEILKAKTERDILERRWQNAKAEAAKAKGEAQIDAEVEARCYADELASFVVPEPTRLLADDATPEAVAGLLAEQRGRLTIASTEGGIFDIVGGRYSDSNPNLDVYLKGYSGDTMRVDRRSRPPEFVANPALTVILTVQPDVIADLASRKAFRGRGFLARWLYSVPRSKVGHRKIDAPPVTEGGRRMWDSLLRQILALPVPDPDSIPLIQLSTEAQALFREFRQVVEANLLPGEELDDLADWGNKLPGHVARIAGSLHIAEWAANSVYKVDSVYADTESKSPWSRPIAPETMVAAIALGVYFKTHAQAAFALMGADSKIVAAKKIWAVIQKHNLEVFTVRDLWQKVRRSFGKVSQLKETLDVLEEMNYIRRAETQKREGPGQTPSPSYEVNPLSRTRNTQCTQNRGTSQQTNNTPHTQNTQNPHRGSEADDERWEL